MASRALAPGGKQARQNAAPAAPLPEASGEELEAILGLVEGLDAEARGAVARALRELGLGTGSQILERSQSEEAYKEISINNRNVTTTTNNKDSCYY